MCQDIHRAQDPSPARDAVSQPPSAEGYEPDGRGPAERGCAETAMVTAMETG
ncbi:protein of unassigned function [Methylobacterium oryzae CBMB20]|uniref:Protein of unassigned function n=1 Tax=Methylobacterium oryzae CBMB20 TaxID=693986 RepID=A0A089NXU2_9HYPH|nr:protein of unassigned function [Methylobacterium oryzae CBMB20]